MGFQYFARGTVVSHASFRIVRTGVPVNIRGLTVRAGDLLHGDENGLVSVPPGHEQEFDAAVDQIRDRERRDYELGAQREVLARRFSRRGGITQVL